VIIAVATVVNLIVSGGLWRTTVKSLQVTRDVFFAANRPYVGIEAMRAQIGAVAPEGTPSDQMKGPSLA
jgi:hypothetical protein